MKSEKNEDALNTVFANMVLNNIGENIHVFCINPELHNKIINDEDIFMKDIFA